MRNHKTKWTVLYLASGGKRYFNSREEANSIAFEAGCAVQIIPPLYM